VLLISPWLPWPPHDGGRIRILETLRFLAAHHRVTLLTHISSEEERAQLKAVRGLCERIEVEFLSSDRLPRIGRVLAGLLRGYPVIQSIYYSPRLARRVTELTAAEPFDIVQVEFSMIARYVRAVSPGSHARRVLSTHNIETQRFAREIPLAPWGLRRLALLSNALLFPAWEQKSVRLFDGAVAVSEQDREWLRPHLPGGRVSLVPNGVDTDFFQPMAGSTVEPALVFTGVMDYPPNIDAVLWFANEIFPRLRERDPGLRFDIVGSRPSQRVLALRDRPGIRVTGEVPDIRPYVCGAAAFVVPLRSGGGTRLKILQAMALGCPVISTRIGAEGLEVTDGETVLFAEDAAGFSARLAELLDSSELRQRLVQRGRALVTSRYDWQGCLAGVEQLYRQLTGSGTA
jgi:sugar transferase (PEP-CTERM/EpsH1 system associated)